MTCTKPEITARAVARLHAWFFSGTPAGMDQVPVVTSRVRLFEGAFPYCPEFLRNTDEIKNSSHLSKSAEGAFISFFAATSRWLDGVCGGLSFQ